MPFNPEQIQSVEFGVCLDTGPGESYRLVPCVAEVQEALKDMLAATWEAIFKPDGELQEFSPAEKYAATERLWVGLASELVTKHREAYEAENLPSDTAALEDVNRIVSYFGVFRDADANKLMAVRRAAQFKGILQKKLICFADDALRIVEDDVFKLDTDFDFYICDDRVYILRPTGFVFVSEIDGVLAASALANVNRIQEDLACVDFTALREYVSEHKLAMRLVAAIKSRNDLAAISRRRLHAECRDSGIQLITANGKLVPAEGSEMGFLMLLDRRRYTLTLIDKHRETYEAPSRHSATRADQP